MDYLVYILLFNLISYSILKSRLFRIFYKSQYYFLGIFVLKLVISYAAVYLFAHQYDPAKADLFRFFRDGQLLFQEVIQHPSVLFDLLFSSNNLSPEAHNAVQLMNNWSTGSKALFWSDNRLMILFHFACSAFSFGNIHIHNLVAVYLAFLGASLLIKAFRKYFIDRVKPLFFLSFALPSFLFFTSFAIKDSILLFGIGLLVYSALRVKSGIKKLLLLVFSTTLLLLCRIHIFLILPTLLLLWLFSNSIKLSLLKTTLITASVAIIAVGIWTIVQPENQLVDSIVNKYNAYVELALQDEAGSLINNQPLEKSLGGILKSIPNGLVNVFLRPFPGKLNGPLSWMALFENIFVLLAIAYSIIHINRHKIKHNISWFLLAFISFNYLLIAVSIPVTGAIIRYKAGIHIFLFMLLLYLINTSALQKIPLLGTKTRTSEK